MTVLSLTPVLSHGHSLEFCARHNSAYVDAAYYALAPEQTTELRTLERLARENLPIRILTVTDVRDLKSTYEQARNQITQLHSTSSTLLVLSTNDLLTSRLNVDTVKDRKRTEFSVVRHFTYLKGLGRQGCSTISPVLRVDGGAESFAFGISHLDNAYQARTIDDPLSGFPELIDRHRDVVDNFSILKLPIMNVEQFLLETIDSWLALKQRRRARGPFRGEKGSWFERTIALIESNGASLDTYQLEDWFENQMSSPRSISNAIELDLLSNMPVTNSHNLQQIVRRTISAIDSAHQFELSQQTDLRRERLRRLHDGLAILLADLPWLKTWVWKDRAAVLERKWNGVPIAFDVFLTSDEITVQLVNRQKQPLPEITPLLAERGIPEVGVAGKPGRYVVGAVQLKSSDYSIKETHAVSQLIRTIIEGMTDHGAP